MPGVCAAASFWCSSTLPRRGAETIQGAIREGRVSLAPETDLPVHFSTSFCFRSLTVRHAFHPGPDEGASRFHAIGASSRTIMGFGAWPRITSLTPIVCLVDSSCRYSSLPWISMQKLMAESISLNGIAPCWPL